MGEAERRAPGVLEQQVLATILAADEPLTPAQVRDALGGDLAYTTVMTVLARLHDKGHVNRQRAGRAYAYTAVRDTADVRAWQMRRVLDAGDDRATVLSRFVGSLSTEDERLLRSLLADPGEDPR